MFPPGEGPSPRVSPASLPTPQTTTTVPVRTPGSNDPGPSDEAARVRALQRQIQEQIERLQAQLAEQRRQAAEAKRRAQEAARRAWEAEEAAKRAKGAEDKQRTRADAEQKNAELDAASAEWQVKSKQAKLTEAKLEDAQAQKKDPTSTQPRKTQGAVHKAEGELTDAKEVKSLLDARVTAMKKEKAALKAEAEAPKPVQNTPLSPQQQQAAEKAQRLRAEATDASGEFNTKLVAWDVKQKKARYDAASAAEAKRFKDNPMAALHELQSPALAAARADYDDALARQKVVNASAGAAKKQLLALDADDKVKAAQGDLLDEQKQLNMCMADSPATRALTTAQDKAKKAHAEADTALADAAQQLHDYELDGKKQALDAAKADLQSLTGGRYGPYAMDTPAGRASAKVFQLQKEYDQLKAGGESTQTTLATARSQELLASLGSAKQEDPAALWKLFSEGDNATTLAQPMLNQYHLQYGDQAHAMDGTYLDNMVGMTLGMKPAVDLNAIQDPKERERVLHEQKLFTSGEDTERIKTVRDKLGEASDEVGGDKGAPKVALLPVVWGSKDVGMTTTTLYRVDGPEGEKFVDDRGNVYDDWHEYRYENGLPPTDSKIVLPKDGHLKVDDNGNVITETGKASLESGWDKFKREWHMDYVIAGVTIAGGVLVDAAGIITMPIGVGVGLEVLGTSMIVAGIGYGAYEAGHDLYKLADHNQSLNPVTSSQARMDWIMLGSSVLAGGSVRAAFKGSMAATGALRAEAAGATEAAASARALSQGYRSQALKLGVPAAAAGLEPMAEQTGMAIANWDRMTDGEKSQYWQQMALGASQIFVNPALRSGMKTVAVRNGWLPPHAGGPGSLQAGARTESPEAAAAAVPDPLAEVTSKSGDLAVGAAHERGELLDVPRVEGEGGAPRTVPVADPGTTPAAAAPALPTNTGAPPAGAPEGGAAPHAGQPGVRPTANTPPTVPAPLKAGTDPAMVSLTLRSAGVAPGDAGAGTTPAGVARPDAGRGPHTNDPGAPENNPAAQARDPRQATQARARDPRSQALAQLQANHPRAVVDAQGRISVTGADGRPLGGRIDAADLRYTSAKTGADVQVPGGPPHEPPGGPQAGAAGEPAGPAEMAAAMRALLAKGENLRRTIEFGGNHEASSRNGPLVFAPNEAIGGARIEQAFGIRIRPATSHGVDFTGPASHEGKSWRNISLKGPFITKAGLEPLPEAGQRGAVADVRAHVLHTTGVDVHVIDLFGLSPQHAQAMVKALSDPALQAQLPKGTRIEFLPPARNGDHRAALEALKQSSDFGHLFVTGRPRPPGSGEPALTGAPDGGGPAVPPARNVAFDGPPATPRGSEAVPQPVGGKRNQVRALPERAEAYDRIRKGEAPGSLFKPSAEQTALLDHMISDRPARPGDTVLYTVAGRPPAEAFVDGGGQGLVLDEGAPVFTRFDAARQAAAGGAGAWVYRIAGPDGLIADAMGGTRLDPRRIEGAVRVFDDGTLFPAAAPNVRHEVPYVNPQLVRAGVKNPRQGRYWQEAYADAGFRLMNLKNGLMARFGRAEPAPRAAPETRPEVSDWAREMVGQPRRSNRVADVHFHRLPYDRRLKLGMASMLAMAGDEVRIAFGAIPQACGKGYYSAKDSWELTFKNAWRLDRRFAKDFMSLTPEQQARTDVMITGKNPAEAGFKAYVKQLMVEHPGVFKGIGELTVHKEYVTAMLGKKESVKLTDTQLREVFEVADELGLVLLVHNDWGHAPVGPDGLHTAGHEGYHHFDQLVGLAAQHPNTRLVLAHTGWARYFQGSTEPGRITLNGQERVVPEHVARMHAALERSPNVHFDISWNDVGEAYVFNPKMGDALVDFVMEHPDRVLFGSDSVKPPNQAYYEQNRTTLEPLLDRIEARSPLAAWLLERGNHERLFGGADLDTARWTGEQLRTKGRGSEADAMDTRLDTVRGLQRDARERLIRDDPRLVAQLKQLRQDDPSNPLLRQFDDIDLDAPLPQRRTAGAGARPAAAPAGAPEGGSALPSLQHLLDSPDPATVARTYLGDRARIEREGGNVTPSSHEARNESKGRIAAMAAALGLTSTGAAGAEMSHLGPAAQNNADMAAFFFRSVAGLGRGLYKEWVRFAGESIFEEGHITPEKIDWYIGRIQKLGCKTGLDESRIQQAIGMTEQFRVDIEHIQNAPLRPGETHGDRFKAVSAAAGLWGIRLDRALGVQSAALDATNPRTKLGQFIRLVVLTTFTHNAVKNGIYFGGPEHTFLESAQHGMYLLADTALATHAAFGLASGRNGGKKTDGTWAGSNWEERVPAIRKLQTAAMPLFSAASAALTAVDLSHGNVPAALMDAGFTVGTGWTARNEIMADRRLGQPSPWRVAAPALLTSLAIAARVLYGYGDVQDPAQQQQRNAGTGTPGGPLPPQPAEFEPPALRWPGGLPGAPRPELPHETAQVDGGQRATGTLWGIAEQHVDSLLTRDEQAQAARRGGHDAVVAQALSQLIQLNPGRFRPELADGVASAQAGDPDTLLGGWSLDVDRASASLRG